MFKIKLKNIIQLFFTKSWIIFKNIINFLFAQFLIFLKIIRFLIKSLFAILTVCWLYFIIDFLFYIAERPIIYEDYVQDPKLTPLPPGMPEGWVRVKEPLFPFFNINLDYQVPILFFIITISIYVLLGFLGWCNYKIKIEQWVIFSNIKEGLRKRKRAIKNIIKLFLISPIKEFLLIFFFFLQKKVNTFKINYSYAYLFLKMIFFFVPYLFIIIQTILNFFLDVLFFIYYIIYIYCYFFFKIIYYIYAIKNIFAKNFIFFEYLLKNLLILLIHILIYLPIKFFFFLLTLIIKSLKTLLRISITNTHLKIYFIRFYTIFSPIIVPIKIKLHIYRKFLVKHLIRAWLYWKDSPAFRDFIWAVFSIVTTFYIIAYYEEWARALIGRGGPLYYYRYYYKPLVNAKLFVILLSLSPTLFVWGVTEWYAWWFEKDFYTTWSSYEDHINEKTGERTRYYNDAWYKDFCDERDEYKNRQRWYDKFQ